MALACLLRPAFVTNVEPSWVALGAAVNLPPITERPDYALAVDASVFTTGAVKLLRLVAPVNAYL